MIEDELDYDEDEAEGFGPAMAIPPLYVLRAAERCPECGKALYVYSLGCAAFHDPDDSRPIEAFHFLSFISELPEPLLSILKTKCPGYRLDMPDQSEAPHMMNHCGCGARIEESTLHWDSGGAFSPDTPKGYGSIKLFRLPIDEAIPIQCSYSLGGGEYLEVGKAQPWTVL